MVQFQRLKLLMSLKKLIVEFSSGSTIAAHRNMLYTLAKIKLSLMKSQNYQLFALLKLKKRLLIVTCKNFKLFQYLSAKIMQKFLRM